MRIELTPTTPAAVADITDVPLRLRAADYLGRAVFFGAVALVCLSGVPYGSAEPWWGAATQCAAFSLGALWIIEGLLRGGGWLRRGQEVLLPLVAAAAFAAFQSLSPFGGPPLSADPFASYLVALEFLSLATAGAVLTRYCSDVGRLRFLTATLVLTGVGFALFALLRQTAQQGGGELEWFGLAAGEGYGHLVNPSHFALLMEMAFGLLLGLWLARSLPLRQRLLLAAAAVPVWTALILSLSRGGILSMLCQVLFASLLWGAARARAAPPRAGRGRRHAVRSIFVRAALSLAILCTVAAGVIWTGGEPLIVRLEGIQKEVDVRDDGGNNINRPAIWRASWELFKANPIVGAGFGGYLAGVSEHHDSSGEMTPYQAHNDYLEVLASGGLVGAGLLLWFLCTLGVAAARQLRSADPFRRAACFGALVGLSGVAVHSLTDFGLHVPSNALYCVALVAVATARVGGEPTLPEGLGIKKPPFRVM